jgi:plastocyanin
MMAGRWAALAVILVLGTGGVRADELTVEIANFTFNPTELTIKPGSTVTWKNTDDIPHSVVEENTKFRSKPLDTGETFSMTFTQTGEIGYFCGLHPQMKGKIIVKQ